MGHERDERGSRLIKGKGERGKKRDPGREKAGDFGRKEKRREGGRVN